MPDLQTQQLMKQPPNNRIQKQMQDRSFLWCIQLISFHNACIIHGAMPLYMVLCHYTWCYAIIHGDMPFFRASEILKTKCQKAPSRNKAFRQSWEQVANSSVGTASDWKVRLSTDAAFSRVSFQSPCAIECVSSCVHVKNPKHWQPYHCLDHENAAHTDTNG